MRVLDTLLRKPRLGALSVEDLTFEAGPLVLRVPLLRDYAAWAQIRAQSRAFLRPWEPTWPEDDLTEAAFRRRINRYHDEVARDEGYPFFLFLRDGGAVVGGLNLRNIRRASAQMGTLGYWMGEAHAGQGLMSQAVGAACRFGFSRLALLRIEAACLPENAASIRVLQKAGFQREGYARAYLAIAGQRRDHVLFAVLSPDQPAQGGGETYP